MRSMAQQVKVLVWFRTKYKKPELSQKEFSTSIGMAQTTYSHYEHGDTLLKEAAIIKLESAGLDRRWLEDGFDLSSTLPQDESEFQKQQKLIEEALIKIKTMEDKIDRILDMVIAFDGEKKKIIEKHLPSWPMPGLNERIDGMYKMLKELAKKKD